jgi:hypothetical protein
MESVARKSRNQFHHESADAGGLLYAVKGGNARVVQCGENLRFTLEAGEPIAIVGERVREDLDRDIPIQSGVPGPIDLAHPSRAQGTDNLVRSEPRGRRERHRGKREL